MLLQSSERVFWQYAASLQKIKFQKVALQNTIFEEHLCGTFF